MYIAIVEDARLPNRYRMLLSTVDVIFADVAQPDQARIVIFNAQSFLKDGGHVIISIKASCIDSTAPPDEVFRQEVDKLKKSSFKPIEQVTLEPYERDHAMVTGKRPVPTIYKTSMLTRIPFSCVPKTPKESVVVNDSLGLRCICVELHHRVRSQTLHFRFYLKRICRFSLLLFVNIFLL